MTPASRATTVRRAGARATRDGAMGTEAGNLGGVMNASLPNRHTRDTPRVVSPPAPGLRFGLSALMLLMTLISVCLAVYAAVPALGACLAVVSLPALVRTALVARLRRQYRRPLSVLDCVGEFAIAFLMTLSTITALLVAFLAPFVPATIVAWTLNIDAMYVVAWLTGFAFALVVFLLIVKHAWPLPKWPPETSASGPRGYDQPDSPAPRAWL